MFARDSRILRKLERGEPVPADLTKEEWLEVILDIGTFELALRKREVATREWVRLENVFEEFMGTDPENFISNVIIALKEDLPVQARKLLCAAMDELVTKLLTFLPQTKDLLREVIFFSSSLEGALDSEVAARIVNVCDDKERLPFRCLKENCRGPDKTLPGSNRRPSSGHPYAD